MVSAARARGRRCTAVRTISTPVLAAATAALTSQIPPVEASPRIAGCCHWVAPSSAHGPPSASQERAYSVVTQTAGTTSSASSARRSVSGGCSSRWTAYPKPPWSAPNSTASTGSPGPMDGTSQYIAVRMKPAPNHHPRTAASRPPGARCISSIPGTSATHASQACPGAGKASTGTAPAARAPNRAR